MTPCWSAIPTATLICVNYGVFEFGPGFIGNFIRGKWNTGRRSNAGEPAKAHTHARIARHGYSSRTSNARQRRDLILNLQWSLRPENTKLSLRLLSRQLHNACARCDRSRSDGEIGRQLKSDSTPTRLSVRIRVSAWQSISGFIRGLNWRWARPRCKLSAWDETFLPARLMEQLNDRDDRRRHGKACAADQEQPGDFSVDASAVAGDSHRSGGGYFSCRVR